MTDTVRPFTLFNPYPKPNTPRDKKHLAKVRLMPCCVCGKPGPSDPHHVPNKDSGTGTKTSDYRTVPLCKPYWCIDYIAEGCHKRHDRVGMKTFWREAGLDPEEIIAEVVAKCGGL